MPEGPSIVILKEDARIFEGQKVIDVKGNAKIDLKRISGEKMVSFKTWSKQLLICFDGFYIRVHLLLFGSYRINEKRDMPVRLSLKFKNGELNFYNSSVKLVEGKPEKDYDWELDTMSDKWNGERAFHSLQKMNETMICDALVDQDIFAGSGNIIKNEILFKMRTHPESLVGAISDTEKKKLVKALREFCFDFYHWKRALELKLHYQIYKQRICPRCKIPVIVKYTGKSNRKSYFCTSCQVLKKLSVRKRGLKAYPQH
jgi:endonuclease-8